MISEKLLRQSPVVVEAQSPAVVTAQCCCWRRWTRWRKTWRQLWTWSREWQRHWRSCSQCLKKKLTWHPSWRASGVYWLAPSQKQNWNCDLLCYFPENYPSRRRKREQSSVRRYGEIFLKESQVKLTLWFRGSCVGTRIKLAPEACSCIYLVSSRK